MSENRGYYIPRAEQGSGAAQRPLHPAAVRAQFILATLCLERAYPARMRQVSD
jgi:hypothetical protein